MNKRKRGNSLVLPDSPHRPLPPGHPESARSIMMKAVSTAKEGDLVADILRRLHSPRRKFATVDYTYVLDSDGHLAGVISIKELLEAAGSTPVSQVMSRKLVAVRPSTDQERVAHLALKYNIKAVPVIDKDHTFLGVVTSDTLLNVLQWEHSEDLLRMSGVHGTGKELRGLHQQGIVQMSRARIPSLIIGVLGGLVLTGVMQEYQRSLQEQLVLAFFIPILLYVCAAVGVQTGAILVRTLSMETVRLRSYIVRELAVGVIIALILAGFLFGAVMVWFGSLAVAMTIGISLSLGIMTSVLLGIFIPWTLARLHFDPAVSGGPFINVAQDALTLLIYFTVANAVLL